MIDFSKEKEVICIKENNWGFKIGHSYIIKQDKYNGMHYAALPKGGISGLYLNGYYNDFFKKIEQVIIKEEKDYYTWLAKR